MPMTYDLCYRILDQAIAEDTNEITERYGSVYGSVTTTIKTAEPKAIVTVSTTSAPCDTQPYFNCVPNPGEIITPTIISGNPSASLSVSSRSDSISTVTNR